MNCKSCNGTKSYQYDHNHSKMCEHCCNHDSGWWQLKDHYGEDNDKWCCKAGCGTVQSIAAGLEKK
jgi:hypothetical protein